MAITSTGYDGTVDEIQAAIRDQYSGAAYGFGGYTDFQPSIGAGTRNITFEAGKAWGRHVLTTSTAQETRQMGTIASGTRWDTFVLRRNWSGAGGTADIVVVAGTSTQAVAGGLNSNPGVLDDQLICIAQVTAGQTAPTALIDLRSWPSKVIQAGSLMAIKDPVLGMRVDIGSTQYVRVRSGGSDAWHTTTSAQSSDLFTPSSGWSITSLDCIARRDGNTVHVDLEFRRSGSDITPSSTGGITDVTVGTLAASWRPDETLPTAFRYLSAANATYMGLATINSSGLITLNWLSPSVALAQQSSGVSVTLHASYSRSGI